MATITREELLRKLDKADTLPSLPAAVAPLITYLQQPLDSLQVGEVTRLISQDESLTAKCLQMANSPLYGHWQQVETLPRRIAPLIPRYSGSIPSV